MYINIDPESLTLLQDLIEPARELANGSHQHKLDTLMDQLDRAWVSDRPEPFHAMLDDFVTNAQSRGYAVSLFKPEEIHPCHRITVEVGMAQHARRIIRDGVEAEERAADAEE